MIKKGENTMIKLGNIYPSKGQNGNIYASNGLSPTISSGTGINGHGIGSNNSPKIYHNLRIRKLTPKECWRLMGFKDESFEKAEKVNSNTQLYKQAGNSIVVNVLEKIISNLHLDLEHIKLLELFGGIGACTEAMKNIGINFEVVDYVEIDKYAVASYNAIHNTNFEPQDITTWDKDIKVDFVMHGSPCQDFSLAGKQAGGDEGSGTRSSLMYETVRIVEKLRPKYVLWENVKNVISKKHKHNFDSYLEKMESLGYSNYYQVLNAKDYGIPQNRERVFTVSILDGTDYEFPKPMTLKLKLKDMLENEVDEKYYLTDSMINYLENGKYNSAKVSNKLKQTDTGICPTLDTMQGGNRQPFIEIKEATKQGYKIAYEGDGINISSRMKYQRGNVQKQTIQTITTSGGNDRGVVVAENKWGDLD